jgi:Putative Ig domain
MSFTPPSGTTFNVYRYEAFDISIGYPGLGTTYSFTTAGSTPTVANLVTSSISNYIDISSSSYNGTPSQETLAVNIYSGGSLLTTGVFPVFINPGRFLPLTNPTSLSLYVGETTNLPVVFSTQQLPIQLPIPSVNGVSATLPVGLQFSSNASNSWSLTGKPLLQAASRPYTFTSIGSSNTSAAVSSNLSIVVNPERIQFSPPGPLISNTLTNGIPYTQTITAAYNNSAIGNLRYSWTALPSNFQFLDICGNVLRSPFITNDLSSTIVLSGTPNTSTLANFVSTGNSILTTLTAQRVSAPILSNSLGFQFSMNRTVVLTPPSTIANKFVGLSVSNSNEYFSAATQFTTSNIPISNIFSINLPSDLSTSFTYSNARMVLTGIPQRSYGTQNYTFRAVNNIGDTTDIVVPITIINDAITLTNTFDACATFVLSRNVSNSLSGYYNSPYTVTANALSGNPVSFVAPVLSGTGLFLNTSGNQARISGTPTIPLGRTDLTVTATVSGTNVSSNASMVFFIASDTITLDQTSATFYQNQSFGPLQLTGKSTSQNPVVGFSSPDIPAGLSISPTGILSGSILSSASGSFTVIASTGFSSASIPFTYTVVPDNILLFTDQQVNALTPGSNVSVQIRASSYSGTPIGNYRFSNLDISYGLSINSNTGLIGGTLWNDVPPNALPSFCNFYASASAGLIDGSLNLTLTSINSPVEYNPFFAIAGIGLGNVRTGKGLTVAYSSSNIFDFQFANSNTLVATTNNGVTPYILRSTDGINFTQTAIGDQDTTRFISSVINIPNTSNWYAVGYSPNGVGLWKSTDNAVTWSLNPINVPNFSTRDLNGAASSYLFSSFVNAGVALAYDVSSQRLLLGGGSNSIEIGPLFKYTTDFTNFYNANSGALNGEIAYLNTDRSDVFLMSGTNDPQNHSYAFSSNYQSEFSTIKVTTTLLYSTNSGNDWSNVTWTSGILDVYASEIVYGNNTWFVTGVYSNSYQAVSPGIAFSTDGSNWARFDLSSNPLWPDVSYRYVPPLPISGPSYDSIKSQWNVFVTIPGPTVLVYSHNSDTTTFTDPNTWTARVFDTTVAPPPSSDILKGYTFGSKGPLYFFSLGAPQAFLQSSFQTSNSPILTSPTQTSYLFYEYMPITPIVLTAQSQVGGQLFYYADTTKLPIGLKFNPITHTVSGTPARLGKYSVLFFVEDGNNSSVTTFTLTFEIIVPRVLRQQTSAGAYTSYIRQYTEVNAAQDARDNEVYPSQVKNLGEFMSPPAPDVITACTLCAGIGKSCGCSK